MSRRNGLMVVRVLIAAGIMATASLHRTSAQVQPMEINPKALEEASFLSAGRASPLALPKSTDGEVTKLRKERYTCAYEELKSWDEGWRNGPITGGVNEKLLECYLTRVLEAELALCQRPEDRVSVYSRAIAFAKANETLCKVRFNSGRVPLQDVKKAQFVRLGIEIKLLEAKEEAAKAQHK
jgi:hypothetical protein